MMIDPQLAAVIRKLRADSEAAKAVLDALKIAVLSKPKSITEEIDALPGRRIFYTMIGSQTFTSSSDGKKGNAIAIPVSQDGPFVMTHYPMAIWKVTSPSNATNFGIFRPVTTWPLPDQVLDTDLIDISYEFADGGSQRNFQNSPVPPLFSRPDALMPLPVPTLFAPNASISITPTYENISFNSSGTASDGGTLYFLLPGYRIVNM